MILNLKRYVKGLGDSNNYFLTTIYKIIKLIYRFLTLLKNLIITKSFRSIFFNAHFKSNHIHQTTISTYFDRYPDVFSSCKEYFNDRQEIKILSFGCSTGEELITLREYFPKSIIVGADINSHCIRESLSKTKDDSNTLIIKSSHNNIVSNGPYDAIFCMAVLQRTPSFIRNHELNNINHIYSFNKFDKQLEKLNEYVKDEGVLVVHFTPYLFKDSSIMKLYKEYGHVNQKAYSIRQFSKEGNILLNEPPQRTIHIKLKSK